jgi:capsular exopolysaccharide synthesis family protein
VSTPENQLNYGLEPSGRQGGSVAAVLRRRWLTILIVTVVCGAVAAAFALANRNSYESTAKLLFLQTIGPDLNALGLLPATQDADNLTADNVELVNSRRVAAATSQTLRARGVDLSTQEISDDATASAEPDSDVVSLVVKADSAERAALIANVYAEEAQRLAQADERKQAEKGVASLQAQLAELPPDQQQAAVGAGSRLRRNIEQLRTVAEAGTGSPRIIQAGYVPTSKAGNPSQTILLGLLFGAVLGAGLALLREQADRRLHGAEEAAGAFEAPVLTTVPRHRALKRHEPFADLPPEVAEAFRMLQMNLRYGWGDPVQSVMITSSRTREGKTTLAWNLACAAVSGGLDVALVEADMRRPTLAERYGLQPGPGLTEVVEGRTYLTEALQPILPVAGRVRGDRAQARLDVLVAGQLPPDPWAVLQSDAMAWILETLKQDHGLVVIDTPPIPHVADAISLVRNVDGVIVAASANVTRGHEAVRLREQLRGLDANVLGVVVNGGSAVSGYGYVPKVPTDDVQGRPRASVEMQGQAGDARRND